MTAKTIVADKIIDIIVEHLNVDEEKMVPNATFMDDMGADSLDQVELIMAMEEAFDIKIPKEDVAQILTVREVIDYVEKRLAGEASY